MQESSFFEYLDEYFDETKGKEHYQRGVQQGREEGIQQGARQIATTNLFAVLESRFDDDAVQSLKPAVERIQDPQCLEELFQEALSAESFESFARVLGMNGDEQ